MKRRFLVTLDYQTGGVAAFVYANSKTELRNLFPKVDIFDLEVDKISDYFNDSNTLVTDIDDLTGWLKVYYDNIQRLKKTT